MVQLIINDGTDILNNLWENLISTGARTRRHDSSRTGLLFSAIATELNVAISLLQSYANQYSIDTMTDRILIENMAAQYAQRRLASKSKAILVFYRMEGFTDSVKIPAGFAVRANTAGNIIFKTASTVYLPKGTQSVSVAAYSLNSGDKNNVQSNSLTIFANDTYNGLIGVTNPEPSFGGYNDESISNLQQRAQGFRYVHSEGTLLNIQDLLYKSGVQSHQYLLQEYIDGPGTFLVCIDTDSDDAFKDAINRVKYSHTYGVTPVFVRATRLYIDMYITVQTAHEIDYTPNEKNALHNEIHNAVQQFFAGYCTVGADIRLNSLKAAINNTLNGYDIANIDIDIANSVTINNKNVIEIANTTIAYPNKILTTLEYVGAE